MSTTTVVLVTGANTGLGFEIVKALAQSSRAYTILLGGRNLDKAIAAADQLKTDLPQSASTWTPVQIDVEDDDSINKLYSLIDGQYGRVDVLINNAGAMFDTQLGTSGASLREMWNKSWDVNTAGTYVLTYTFVPLLLKSSDPRLLFVTSGTANLTEHSDPKVAINTGAPKGWPKPPPMGVGSPAYRSVKTGLNMMMKEWSRVLKEDGVKVWAISPGLLATGLGGNPEFLKKIGAKDPALGGNLIKTVVEGVRDQDVGQVVTHGRIQPW